MILNSKTANKFITGYKELLLEIHRMVGLKPSSDLIHTLVSARSHLIANPRSIDEALLTLAKRERFIDQSITQAVRSLQVERWVYLRSTTRLAIFIDPNLQNAYGVLGLTDRIDILVGAKSATFIAGVFKLEGHYVCDGLIKDALYLGPNYKAEFNSAFSTLKKNGSFFSSYEP